MQNFKIHQFTGQIQNNFVVEYSDKLLIMDGGCRRDAIRIERFITTNLKRPMTDVKLIIVTHMHPDHAGGAPLLRKKFGIPIAAHYLADDWYKGFSGSIQHVLDTAMAWFVVLRSKSKIRRMWYRKQINPNYLLKDSSKIPFFEDWEAIHTPGHTSHDISIYNKEQKIVYVADVVLEINSKCKLPFPVTMPDIMAKTLDKLSNYQIAKIDLAHAQKCSIKNEKDFFIQLKPLLNQKLKGAFKIFRPFTRLSSSLKNFDPNENK